MKYIISLLIFLTVVNVFSKDKEKKDSLVFKTKDVVVTAMRYPEYIIEVPLAISIIDKNFLENSKGYGLNEALAFVPGVLSQSRYGNQDVRITIRGFGARGAGDRSNAGTSRGIKFFVDGIPETEPDGRTSFDNIDLSLTNKIEVIRSNASALWGNAAGGVVSISTVPYFSTPFMQVSTMAGSYGFQKYILESGTNLGSSRLYGGVTYSKYDGFRQNSQSSRFLANIGLISALNDKAVFGLHITGTSNEFYIPGPITQTQFDSSYSMANPTYLTRLERRYNNSVRIGTTFEYNFDKSNTLNVVGFLNPKYLQRSERGTYRDFTRYHLGGSMNFRNSTNLSSDLKNVAMAGFDESFQDGAILFYSLTEDGQRGGILNQNKSEGANSFGAFFQNEMVFNESISLLLGVRYDNIAYHSQDFTQLDTRDVKTFKGLTPKFALSYRFTPEHSIYFNIGGGVEVPAGNETDPPTSMDTLVFNPLLDPIKSTTFELGTKQFILFQNSPFSLISYDVALYLIKTTNDIIPYAAGAYYYTAGETERKGIEIGLTAETVYGLSLRTAFSYAQNKYSIYMVDTANYKNNKMAGLPDYYYNIGLRYTSEYLDEAFAEVIASGVGSYFADDANKYNVPSYTILNFTLGMNNPYYVSSGLGVRAFLAVNNITNQKYVASSFINPDLDKTTKQPKFLEAGLPRNIVLGFSFKID
jgi:iron complex outermembrane receptor protein